jgi:hypothetical protein
VFPLRFPSFALGEYQRAVIFAFKLADADNSGSITRPEFFMLLRSLRHFKRLWFAFKQVDVDQSHTLTLDEFVQGQARLALYELPQTRSSSSSDQGDTHHEVVSQRLRLLDAEAEELFRRIDTDRSGTLRFSELAAHSARLLVLKEQLAEEGGDEGVVYHAAVLSEAKLMREQELLEKQQKRSTTTTSASPTTVPRTAERLPAAEIISDNTATTSVMEGARRMASKTLSAALMHEQLLGDPDELASFECVAAAERQAVAAALKAKRVSALVRRKKRMPPIVRVVPEGDRSEQALLAALARLMLGFGHRVAEGTRQQRGLQLEGNAGAQQPSQCFLGSSRTNLLLAPLFNALTVAADSAYSLDLWRDTSSTARDNRKRGGNTFATSTTVGSAAAGSGAAAGRGGFRDVIASCSSSSSPQQLHEFRLYAMLAFAFFPRDGVPAPEEFLPSPAARRQRRKQQRKAKKLEKNRNDDSNTGSGGRGGGGDEGDDEKEQEREDWALALEAAAKATTVRARRLVVRPLCRVEAKKGLELLGLRLDLSQWTALWYALSRHNSGSCWPLPWERALAAGVGLSLPPPLPPQPQGRSSLRFLNDIRSSSNSSSSSSSSTHRINENNNAGDGLVLSSLAHSGRVSEQEQAADNDDAVTTALDVIAAQVKDLSICVARRTHDLSNIVLALRGAIVTVQQPTLEGKESQFHQQPHASTVMVVSGETDGGGGVVKARSYAGRALMDVVTDKLEQKKRVQFGEGQSLEDDGSVTAALVESGRRLRAERDRLERLIGAFAHSLRSTPPPTPKKRNASPTLGLTPDLPYVMTQQEFTALKHLVLVVKRMEEEAYEHENFFNPDTTPHHDNHSN